MNTQREYIPPTGPLYKLDAAAAAAGVTPEILRSAIKNGDIPGVRILPLGPRKLQYVRSHQFLAWLEGREPPPDPGIEADRIAIKAVADSFDPEYDDLFN